MSLVRLLEKHGHICYWASDIERRNQDVIIAGETVGYTSIVADALTLTTPLQQADCVITNPPWSRTKKSGYLLHRMIEHFSEQNETWLLFDSAWAYTKQSAPYMKYCKKIVAIGRVCWIRGTKKKGKDDCSWYCFDKNHTGDTVFFGR